MCCTTYNVRVFVYPLQNGCCSNIQISKNICPLCILHISIWPCTLFDQCQFWLKQNYVCTKHLSLWHPKARAHVQYWARAINPTEKTVYPDNCDSNTCVCVCGVCTVCFCRAMCISIRAASPEHTVMSGCYSNDLLIYVWLLLII